jgi:hypothetical protein
MTRVLIIGNSHSAALRMAWNDLADRYPGVDLTFFVVGGRPFAAFDLDDQGIFRCVDATSVSREQLSKIRALNDGVSADCNQADHVLLIGKNYGEATIAQICQQWDIDGFTGSGKNQKLSKSAFHAFCRANAESRLPGRHWSALEATVTFAGAPFPSASLKDARSILGAARPWIGLMDRPEGYAEASIAYGELFTSLLGSRSIGFAPQPPETLTEEGFTLPEYLRKAPAKHMRDGEATDDYRHMNEAFGTIRLEAYFRDFVGVTGITRPS